jgi:glutamyl-tRNA synthetase
MKKIRVRIAPSPTGNLHVGTARTALVNYLFAKNNGGDFVLRIEDTDLERSDPKFEVSIIEGLKWLGINWDEGPDNGGEFGKYRQSERTEIYTKYIQKLLDEDKAYYCFCDPKDLEAHREYMLSNGEAPIYSEECANVSKEKALEKIANGEKAVIRFRCPKEKVKFNDLIRGEVEFDGSLLGDFVIAKNVNTPLYNLAVVIDDSEMEISHVIRGEDHVSNTPRQILLLKALEADIPQYAHLPMILGPDKSKLSKRHGATSLIEYRDQGYIAEAMVNFMAFLGWNPGDEREIFSLEELVKEFSIERVHKGGAIFNIDKLNSINSIYIKNMDIDKLTELCIPFLVKAELIKEGEFNIEDLKKYVKAYQDRIKNLTEVPELLEIFFKEIPYEKDLLKWKESTNHDTKLSLDKSEKVLSNIDDFNLETITKALLDETEITGDRGALLWPLRAALSGKKASASPFELANALGKEESIRRINKAKDLL